MRTILLLTAVLLAGSSLRAQTVTLQRANRSENLKTTDSLTATRPCKGIVENLTVGDSVAVLPQTPRAASLSDTVLASDRLAIVFTFTFPKLCVLTIAGSIVICVLAGSP